MIMANLRDKGYPSAKEYRANRSSKKTAVLDNTTPFSFSSGNSNLGVRESSPGEGLMNRLLTEYNSRAFGNPSAPLISRTNMGYVTDDTDSRAYLSGYNLRDHDNNRLAFANRDVRPDRTGYYVGIDNLPFGETPYNKIFNTPLGTISADYDGDSTAALSYETSPNVYYIQALAKALLNRGNL
jgi:hypothetical protein